MAQLFRFVLCDSVGANRAPNTAPNKPPIPADGNVHISTIMNDSPRKGKTKVSGPFIGAPLPERLGGADKGQTKGPIKGPDTFSPPLTPFLRLATNPNGAP